MIDNDTIDNIQNARTEIGYVTTWKYLGGQTLASEKEQDEKFR